MFFWLSCGQSVLANGMLKTYPFGIVLRPSLIQKIFDDINSQREGISFETCVESANFLIRGRAVLHLENPKWLGSTDDLLALGARVQKFEADLSMLRDCSKLDRKPTDYEVAKIALNLKNPVDLAFFISLSELNRAETRNPQDPRAVLVDKIGQESLARSLEIRFEAGRDLTREIEEKISQNPRQAPSDVPSINQIVQDLQLTRLMLESAMRPVEEALSNWLRNRLRSLTYLDYISNVFKNSEIWKDGSDFESGALSMSNPGDRLRQSQIAFGFFPRRDVYLRVGQGAAELYFNSLFIDQSQMRSIVRSPSASSEELLGLVRDFMADDRGSSDAAFVRPLVKSVDADVTLILPESLINGALAEIYQADLKQFSTEIDFGKHAAGLITRQPLPVSLRIQLESPEVPQILFQSNRLNLNVSNYFLSIGTWIEDRLIPSTQVEAKVNVSAGLDVSGSTVNLLVQPETFQIHLSQGRRFQNRFSRNDLDLIQSVSNDIWREFFKRYPKLPLFYTIFKREDSQVKIVNLEVMNEMILLHFNFEEISVDL